ncbi:Protein GAMETE EXPRESSED 2 [Acorus calamus]|uniref:Protein GAMETE EXPRESSED 2 n=1 Tax=Acorus calamus TaxID=4465 RepID=A0AAV9CZ75_ACOCL|nr:Protein GAMETE EXPRESSED 2 [Acorus calamus]
MKLVSEFEAGSKANILILPRDAFGNDISSEYGGESLCNFIVSASYENGSVANLADIKYMGWNEYGYLGIEFVVSAAGSLTLCVQCENQTLLSSPLSFNVKPGYCDGLNSVVNGSGLASSDAGQISYFSVYLEDMDHNPAPVEPDRLHVKIMRRDGAFSIRADVTPMGMSYGGVDMSSSAVVKYAAQVQRNFKNEIVVQLKDSFFNPISLQQASLSLDITPANTSSFLKSKFTEEKDGLYIVYYLLKDAGAYNISIYFDDWHLSPCPLEINVYEREYFPEAHSDTVSVWEDESVSFDVLGNDYFKGELSSFIASSKPQFGSLLQYGKLFRYTPYKGFFGNDSFSYIISDINNNTATSTCIVSVLSIPPQFVSLPGLLQVTEDMLKPRFGSENFYGNDVVTISGTNKNGVREAYVPIFVEPVNDPPFLNVPEYIILEKKISKNGLWIIETPKNVEFSIGDPDLLHFPGM